MSDGPHGVMIIWPPNSGVGIINVFKGNLDSTHAMQTRGGDLFSQSVWNNIMFAFLVYVVWFYHHNFTIIRLLLTPFESNHSNYWCVLSSWCLHDHDISCGLGCVESISLVVCIGDGVIFGCDQDCLFSALQDHCLLVRRFLVNNGILTNDVFVVFVWCCWVFIRGQMGWYRMGAAWVGALV